MAPPLSQVRGTILTDQDDKTQLSIDSSIITDVSKIQFILKNLNFRVGRIRLLYRATQNFSVEAFHQKVDGVGNTLTLIQGGNFVVGGFTTQTWDAVEGFKSDEKAFLFNINDQKIYPVNRPDYAIFTSNTVFTCFGQAPRAVESAFPTSYGDPRREQRELELTNGNAKIRLTELEVFALE